MSRRRQHVLVGRRLPALLSARHSGWYTRMLGFVDQGFVQYLYADYLTIENGRTPLAKVDPTVAEPQFPLLLPPPSSAD